MNNQYLTLYNKIDFKRIIDHPNILIAAAFWEEERYEAAKVCYKYMSAIDDLIDYHKSAHKVIAEDEKEKFTESVHSWINMVREPSNNNPEYYDLISTVRKFHIPSWPLEAFAKSMIYDIHHNGFATLKDFLEYSQGASVAPASIFVHLNGLVKQDNAYHLPHFSVKNAATPCAVFSYIVHIIRDFQKDQLNNLNYFADDIVKQNGLTNVDLKNIANGGFMPEEFRGIIKTYYDLAGIYKQKTFDIIEEISPLLEPRYRLSLQIIFSLYLMVYERIDVEKGKFTTSELNPTPDEIALRVLETIEKFEG